MGAGTLERMITIGNETIYGKPYQVDPARHLTVIGGSGMGKSTLLEHIFLNFIRQGHGGLFIDPHGDTADRLLLLLPKSRMRDLIWFDPDAHSVPPFNPLCFIDPEQLELAKETCLTILKALAGSETAWGNETPYNIRNDLDAVVENVANPTLIHVFRFLTDEEYRKSLLNASQNPFVRLFQKGFDKLRGTDQAAKFAPAINKLAKLMRPNILPIIGQPQSLDPLEIMNGKKIMICRFSKGRLGDETAMILYSLIVSIFSIAALKRERQEKRPPFMIVADEAQNAVHGGRFGTLLAEARKYGISLVTAFQGGYQVPFIKDVLSNSNTQIIFNSSGEDATMMAENWNEQNVTATGITSNLPRFEFYSRTFTDNFPEVKIVKAPPQLKPRRKSAEKIIQQSFMRYSTSKKKTNEKINNFLASSA